MATSHHRNGTTQKKLSDGEDKIGPQETKRNKNRNKRRLQRYNTVSNCTDLVGFFKIRSPVKKAVIIGVCYVDSPEFFLRGCANDAKLFGLSLVHHFGFLASNVLVLTDALPAPVYNNAKESSLDEIHQIEQKVQQGSKASLWPTYDPESNLECRRNPNARMIPTSSNILSAVNWLVNGSVPGDVLVFYFAGHGIQVDNMSGWEGEGYYEAVVPSDYIVGSSKEFNVILAVHLKEQLLSCHSESQITVFLDCVGGQTILDPAGTGSKWTYIKGLKQKGVWPILTDPTNKMYRANYDQRVWLDTNMRRQLTRPRFLPGIEVDNTAELRDPIFQRSLPPSTTFRGYCFAGAAWSQVCVEAVFPSFRLSTIDSKFLVPEGFSIVHGVFTYCLVRGIEEKIFRSNKKHTKRASYNSIILAVWDELRTVKTERLHGLNQVPELSFCTGGNASSNDIFAYPYAN